MTQSDIPEVPPDLMLAMAGGTTKPKGGVDLPEFQFEAETHFTIFLPPGWIISGTIDRVWKNHVALRDAVYIETVHQGKSSIGDASFAKSASELQQVVSSSYPLPDGTIMRSDAILMATPAQSSFRSLARQREAEAVKKAGGRK